jgi:myo-inositol 2-dehydrogenase/D-chiro-inositol 1-dehydrogenase
MNNTTANPLNRRTFLARSAAALAATSVAGFPSIVRAADEKILKLGIVGCGGRGTGALNNALSADKNVVLTAMGDAFRDRIYTSYDNINKTKPDQVKVEEGNKFVGLDAIDQVLATDVDVVILTTPPGFRPLHLKKAVAAGKHVFCEKPVAVDAPGVRDVIATAAEAKRKGLGIQSGFCWRSNYAERETFKQIHSGAIGEVRSYYGTYLGSSPWVKERKPEWSDLEWQLRNWLYFTWLSGDHLVEQAIHTVDKMSWAFKDVNPVSVTALGGRQQRIEEEYGHIYDHFAVSYQYPEGRRGLRLLPAAGRAATTRTRTRSSAPTAPRDQRLPQAPRDHREERVEIRRPDERHVSDRARGNVRRAAQRRTAQFRRGARAQHAARHHGPDVGLHRQDDHLG